MLPNVTISAKARESLSCDELGLLSHMLAYVDRRRRCRPGMRRLAADARENLTWVQRRITSMAGKGVFKEIVRLPNRGFEYEIDAAFLAERRRTGRACSVVESAHRPAKAVPRRSTRATRCFTSETERLPSSGSNEPSEGARSPDQDLREDWKEAAAAERRLAGLPDVDYRVEWRKLLAYSEGAPVTIWRWRGWVLKARADRAAAAPESAIADSPAGFTTVNNALPGDEQQRRRARDWAKDGFWRRDGYWGPAPDQPGCTLPPDLVAWCLAERAAAQAAA